MFSSKAMRLAGKILDLPELKERPPVLLDVGASGFIPPKWRWLAPYAICLAFDADRRDVQHLTDGQSGFRALHVFPAVVSADKVENKEFFLTQSPHCSSGLPPDTDALADWAFAEYFSLERKVKLPSITLSEALSQADVDKIDWFKCDSQGTDLRLFRSLGEELMLRVLVADFEPGIIDAYKGEDKLWSLMSFMDRQPFWMSDALIKGSPRVRTDLLRECLGPLWARQLPRILRSSPGWAEVTYFNDFDDFLPMDKRDYLLAWVFSILEGQYGHAFQLADRGMTKFGDQLFSEMRHVAMRRIQAGCYRLPWQFFTGLARFGWDRFSRALGRSR